MTEWKEYKLGEISSRITKGTTPTRGQGFVERGINYIKSEAISYDGKIDKTTFAFIDLDTHNKLLRSHLQKDDILFSMAGIFLGKSGLVTEDMLPANTNQALAIIRINQDIALPKYVNYFLRQRSIIDYVNNMSGQSAQPNINFQEIASIELSLPPFPEQKAIAGVLSSLDDKIDLLHRQNKTLEGMAEAAYYKYFIENFKGTWNECLIADLSTHLKVPITPNKAPLVIFDHYSIPAFDNSNMPFKELGSSIQSNKYKVFENTLLFSKLNPHKDKRIWLIPSSVSEHSVCSTEFQVIKPIEYAYLFFLYGFLNCSDNYDVIAAGVGGTSGSHQRIDPDSIFKNQCFIPDSITLQNYNDVVIPVFNKINQNRSSIQRLIELRDLLLPKLMCGEVKIKDEGK
jgi:type I restriction enzyme S subunit